MRLYLYRSIIMQGKSEVAGPHDMFLPVCPAFTLKSGSLFSATEIRNIS